MRDRRVLAAMFLFLLAACRREPATPPDVIVKVGERMVTLADFKRYLERNAGTDLAQVTPEVASAMLDQFVEEIVVAEYASAHGVEVPADQIATAVRREAGATVIDKRDEMRREKLIADINAQIPEADDAEVATYYQAHPGEFRSAEEVRVRQILVNDEALAQDILRRLRSGAAFEELSVAHSRAPNASRGGEIGFVSRGELPKMFEEEIFRLQAGQVSEVIRTDSSFHIFKVEERRPAGMLDLASATPLIRARIREEALRDQLAQVVAKGKREIPVSVLTRRLPFEYSGSLAKAAEE